MTPSDHETERRAEHFVDVRVVASSSRNERAEFGVAQCLAQVEDT